MRAFVAILLVSVASAATTPARADEAACRDFAWPLARERAWFADASLRAIDSGATAGAHGAVAIKLLPMARVAFATPPERAPKNPDAFGGVVEVEAPGKAGLFQVTLSEEAWLDVVQNDARVKSAAFSGKQGCPGMRKSVRFSLADAPFVVQISGAAADRLNIAIAPAD